MFLQFFPVGWERFQLFLHRHEAKFWRQAPSWSETTALGLGEPHATAYSTAYGDGHHTPAVISGPVGVGKTTVGNEVRSALLHHGVVHSFIDLDALAETYPRPMDGPFGVRLALANLRAVWANCAAAGSPRLIIARVVETADFIVDTEGRARLEIAEDSGVRMQWIADG